MTPAEFKLLNHSRFGMIVTLKEAPGACIGRVASEEKPRGFSPRPKKNRNGGDSGDHIMSVLEEDGQTKGGQANRRPCVEGERYSRGLGKDSVHPKQS